MTRKCFSRIFVLAGFVIAAFPAASWLTEPVRMPATAAAQSPAASQRTGAEALIRDIENNLIAPCCWVQPISEHPSEISDFMRAQVRAMVGEGKSRKEILDYFVAQYGERILAAPPARGINILAYVAPFLALILGAWGLFLLREKRNMNAMAPVTSSPTPQNDSIYTDIIEKELRELND
jgi:cytochrome c-type biogenesis protein CcmH